MASSKQHIISCFFSAVLVCFTLFPSTSFALSADERPTAINMVGDAVVRPLMLVATVAGTALFAVTLPFSLLGGNAGEAGKVLVVEPFKITFLRCLGCTTRNLKK